MSVNNSRESRDGPPLGTVNPYEFKNSRNQLNPDEMGKIQKLVEWNNSIFARVYSIIKKKVCPTKPKCEFDLATYSIKLLSEPRPSDAEVYDMLRQLIALKQIINNEREITKESVSIFQNSKGFSLLLGGTTLAFCISAGAVLGSAVGLMVGLEYVSYLHNLGLQTKQYKEFLINYPEPTKESYKSLFPDASNNYIDDNYPKYYRKWYEISYKVAFRCGVYQNPDLWKAVTLGTDVGFGLIGFSALTGMPGLPIMASAAQGVRTICKKMNIDQVNKEITSLLLICEVKYNDIYTEVNESLSTTVVNPLEVAPMSLRNFTASGVPTRINNFTASGVPTRMNNFLKSGETKKVNNPLSSAFANKNLPPGWSVNTDGESKWYVGPNGETTWNKPSSKGGKRLRYKKRRTLKKL